MTTPFARTYQETMQAGEDLFGLVGQILDNKYQVEEIVARGGFGVVYRAVHLALLTRHAVKVLRIPPTLPTQHHAQFLQQFVDEARMIASLDHPAVVRVTDFGVLDQSGGAVAPWMVLEWIEGQTLDRELKRRHGLGGRSPRECLDLLRPVLDAIDAAHTMGIAHRDIKPANIMLLDDAASVRPVGRRAGSTRPTIRVLDFGIAKMMGDDDGGNVSGHTHTASAMPAYSPRYASPEQVSRTRTGPWTDVHALALIMTEALTDESAFDWSDPLRLNLQVMSPVRPTPAARGIDVGAWEPVLQRALALNPGDRFASAGEFLQALEEALPAARHRSLHAAHAAVPAGPPVATPTTEPSVVVADVSTLSPSIASSSVAPSTRRSRLLPLFLVVCVFALLAGVLGLGRLRAHNASLPHTSTMPVPLSAVRPTAPTPVVPPSPVTTSPPIVAAPLAPTPPPAIATAPVPSAVESREPADPPAPRTHTTVSRGARLPAANGRRSHDTPAPADHAAPTAPAPVAPTPAPAAAAAPSSERDRIE